MSGGILKFSDALKNIFNYASWVVQVKILTLSGYICWWIKPKLLSNIHTCIRIYIHACMHIYIHKYVHTYVLNQGFALAQGTFLLEKNMLRWFKSKLWVGYLWKCDRLLYCNWYISKIKWQTKIDRMTWPRIKLSTSCVTGCCLTHYSKSYSIKTIVSLEFHLALTSNLGILRH